MNRDILRQTLSGNGSTATFGIRGRANVRVIGTAGTITVEKQVEADSASWYRDSFDDGLGSPGTYALSAANSPLNFVLEEFEPGVLYRITLSNYASNVDVRVGQ